MLLLAIAMVTIFAFINGVTGAATATATLVASRAANPGPAVVLAAVFNLAGPFLLGTAVAGTVGAVIALSGPRLIPVIGAGAFGAAAWTTVTWRLAIPSSSSHALVGGLLGAALLDSGPSAINWLGSPAQPIGVVAIIVALAISPPAATIAGYVLERVVLAAFRRMTVHAAGPVRLGQHLTSAWLAASHGSNDTSKSAGLVASLLVAGGLSTGFDVSPPIILGSAAALTLGTALGGWGIVHTIGRRIFPVRTVDALVSQGSSAAVIFAASLLGAPVSTNQIVASSIVGIGLARRRWHHVRWLVVRRNLATWLTTIPAAGLIAAISLPVWRFLG
ncbi:MAG: inorganic phosphate transporter [Candidatus Limnocylindrales bacterium]